MCRIFRCHAFAGGRETEKDGDGGQGGLIERNNMKKNIMRIDLNRTEEKEDLLKEIKEKVDREDLFKEMIEIDKRLGGQTEGTN